MSIEAGGNAPFIVFDDANLDEAVAGQLVDTLTESVLNVRLHDRRHCLQIPKQRPDLRLRQPYLRSLFRLRRIRFTPCGEGYRIQDR